MGCRHPTGELASATGLAPLHRQIQVPKYHPYWRCRARPLKQFGGVQKELARRFDSDKSVFSLSRVMRLPGFAHRKGEPFMTRA